MNGFDILKIETMSDQISLNSLEKSSRSSSITSNIFAPIIKKWTINENITQEESEERAHCEKFLVDEKIKYFECTAQKEIVMNVIEETFKLCEP